MVSTPEYEFLVSNGPHLQAHGAFRGHAIRKALKTAGHGTSGSAEELVISSSSQKTVELRDSLKRKFRFGRRSIVNDPNARTPGRSVIRDIEPSIDNTIGHLPGNGGMHAIELFENNAVDPFESLPVLASAGMEILLRYFILNLLELYGQRSWFEFAITEAPLMNLTLALSATLWLDACPTLDPMIRQEGIFRKGEAIKAANFLLQGPQISDTLIASVAKLSHIAGAEGAFVEADVHLKGLCQLIHFRGGMQSLRNSMIVARAVTWADLQAAAAIGRPPLLPLIYELQEVTLPLGLLDEVNTPSLEHLEISGPCSIALKRVLLLLRQAILAQRRKIMSARDIAILLNTADTIILNNIDFQTLTTAERRSKIMLLAAHVLSHIALRKWCRTGPVAHALVNRLLRAVATPEVDMLVWLGYLPCLLWTLAIGAVAAEGDKDGMGDWFIINIQNVAQSLRPETERDIERILRLFVWDESFSKMFHHSSFIRVWPASPSR